ncbi:MAG: DUF1624 domain-containing protein, partial [Chitinivibrionales bacterium]|nr:DUF1624 domain-containing protein [Chitinivibrionales bacterium]MBD3396234.1 DUF1624 domain-containing protein [Chitinivibrionales bacterium]
MKPVGQQRNTGLDALRGIAVLLMVQQHLGAWLWDQPWDNIRTLITENPFMMGLNGLGGLAAPLFLVLAGAGAEILPVRHGNHPGRIAVVRGILILVLGYGLNLLVPTWFTPGSWYVLHMIGLGIAFSPLLRRLPSGGLLFAAALVLAGTAVVRALLATPVWVGNTRMGNTGMPGGVFRLVLAEGHFPVLPWLSVFMCGMAAGRAGRSSGPRQVVHMGTVLAAAGLVLALVPAPEEGNSARVVLRWVLMFGTRMYPIPIPLLLILTAASVLAVSLFWFAPTLARLPGNNPLTCIGRCSLSILFLHAVVFRQLSVPLGFFKTLPKPAALAS